MRGTEGKHPPGELGGFVVSRVQEDRGTVWGYEGALYKKAMGNV